MPLERKGDYVRERLRPPEKLRRAGFTEYRTVTQGGHRVILASKPGPRRQGTTRVQAILHPASEVGQKFRCGDAGECERIKKELQ